MEDAAKKESLNPEIRIILYGVGSIGSQIARLLLRKKGLKIVGAVDASPEKIGRDLGEVIGVEKTLGVSISGDSERLLSSVDADVALHATSSFLKDVYPQLAQLIRHGVNVISTCEELTYPYVVDESLAFNLDRLARKHGVTLLGTGVNPGFLMDTLPIALSGLCQEVKHIKVERVIDAAKRRLPFQKKIGAGLTPEEFEDMIEKRIITGHVGLEQSIAMIADALGLSLQRIEAEPAQAHLPVQVAVPTHVVDHGDDLAPGYRLTLPHLHVVHVPVDGVDPAPIGQQMFDPHHLTLRPRIHQEDHHAVAHGVDRRVLARSPDDLTDVVQREEVHPGVVELAEGNAIAADGAETVGPLTERRVLVAVAGVRKRPICPGGQQGEVKRRGDGRSGPGCVRRRGGKPGHRRREKLAAMLFPPKGRGDHTQAHQPDQTKEQGTSATALRLHLLLTVAHAAVNRYL